MHRIVARASHGVLFPLVPFSAWTGYLRGVADLDERRERGVRQRQEYPALSLFLNTMASGE